MYPLCKRKWKSLQKGWYQVTDLHLARQLNYHAMGGPLTCFCSATTILHDCNYTVGSWIPDISFVRQCLDLNDFICSVQSYVYVRTFSSHNCKCWPLTCGGCLMWIDQYHDRCCPGSLCYQVITAHDFENERYIYIYIYNSPSSLGKDFIHPPLLCE